MNTAVTTLRLSIHSSIAFPQFSRSHRVKSKLRSTPRFRPHQESLSESKLYNFPSARWQKLTSARHFLTVLASSAKHTKMAGIVGPRRAMIELQCSIIDSIYRTEYKWRDRCMNANEELHIEKEKDTRHIFRMMMSKREYSAEFCRFGEQEFLSLTMIGPLRPHYPGGESHPLPFKWSKNEKWQTYFLTTRAIPSWSCTPGSEEVGGGLASCMSERFTKTCRNRAKSICLRPQLLYST